MNNPYILKEISEEIFAYYCYSFFLLRMHAVLRFLNFLSYFVMYFLPTSLLHLSFLFSPTRLSWPWRSTSGLYSPGSMKSALVSHSLPSLGTFPLRASCGHCSTCGPRNCNHMLKYITTDESWVASNQFTQSQIILLFIIGSMVFVPAGPWSRTDLFG